MSASPLVRRAGAGGRPALAKLAAVLAAAALLALLAAELHSAARRLALPLTDATVIREQGAGKHVDPALIAAVIYAESKFDPRPSAAGAQGLMQILPATAYYLARLSGGSAFTAEDLATPRINVAYGTYYLRYLLDHYRGAELPAIAAYNAGLSNVDAWTQRAAADGGQLTSAEIPFPETREYVRRVLAAQSEYRSTYPRELGLR